MQLTEAAMGAGPEQLHLTFLMLPEETQLHYRRAVDGVQPRAVQLTLLSASEKPGFAIGEAATAADSSSLLYFQILLLNTS
ncbi:hypothetical protein [Paenibacillus whitsoniae]|uniref:Uncharacterized protein n=1 Tax=Paenibacillus whitsoniae TaxID=2496558 RepID=A0A430JF17_9BACL|nr:hypothetical protein [Paenibacillus whitsoniae]RTE09621.1 hypothetical protein EJQ19_11205 [Paenibacillus whitsoniae]